MEHEGTANKQITAAHCLPSRLHTVPYKLASHSSHPHPPTPSKCFMSAEVTETLSSCRYVPALGLPSKERWSDRGSDKHEHAAAARAEELGGCIALQDHQWSSHPHTRTNTHTHCITENKEATNCFSSSSCHASKHKPNLIIIIILMIGVYTTCLGCKQRLRSHNEV